MNNHATIGVLFVCMGNICRSPTAEGVFRKLAADAGLSGRITIDSAGTHAYHSGEPADRRAAEAAGRRGYSLDGIKARRVVQDDFERFDLVLAMDEDNYRVLHELAREDQCDRVRLMLSYGSHGEREVPDPYYGGAAGFERVLDLIEDASAGLLRELQRKTGAGSP